MTTSLSSTARDIAARALLSRDRPDARGRRRHAMYAMMAGARRMMSRARARAADGGMTCVRTSPPPRAMREDPSRLRAYRRKLMPLTVRSIHPDHAYTASIAIMFRRMGLHRTPRRSHDARRKGAQKLLQLRPPARPHRMPFHSIPICDMMLGAIGTASSMAV